MLSTKQAAQHLGISYYYLRNLRHLQHSYDGPPFVRLKHPRGTACYYQIADLNQWAAKHLWRQKSLKNQPV